MEQAEISKRMKRLLIAGLIVAAVTALDYLTGSQFEVTALYAAGVMYAAWLGGRTVGLAAAALSVAAMIVLDLIQGSPYASQLYFAVNIINKALILVAIASVVARIRYDHKRATESARTDPLTSLANRRMFEERLTLEVERCRRTATVLGCAFIDIDDFKDVNDRFGHDAGDAVLVAAARAITAQLRATDLAARLGGDEFCVLLPGTRRDEALPVVGRIRDRLLEAMREGGWNVTFSIGFAAFDDIHADAGELLAQADRLMYEAKRTGKNRIAA